MGIYSSMATLKVLLEKVLQKNVDGSRSISSKTNVVVQERHGACAGIGGSMEIKKVDRFQVHFDILFNWLKMIDGKEKL